MIKKRCKNTLKLNYKGTTEFLNTVLLLTDLVHTCDRNNPSYIHIYRSCPRGVDTAPADTCGVYRGWPGRGSDILGLPCGGWL